nr:phospholipase D family protein [Aliidiomarina indica]
MWIVITLFWVSGCSSLPALDDRIETSALNLQDARDTTLGRTFQEQGDLHPGKSGIYPLDDAWDAFAARILLAERAEKTLDIQYYIWRNDKTGRLLLSALYDAAERGVRVRLLLDDLNTIPLEGVLYHLHAHPQIEVRLFNPFLQRNSRIWGFITDFDRSNRRMHNKSFTADNQATIVGGRNIGDGYFGTGDGLLFADLDVLAVGPVVQEVSLDFDHFWSSGSTYPLHFIADIHNKGDQHAVTSIAAMMSSQDKVYEYLNSVMDTSHMQAVIDGLMPFEWANTIMVSDDPGKGLGNATGGQLIIHQLHKAIGEPERYFELVSPYFVPTRSGVDALIEFAERGVEITILTNSLAATDVAIVHAGYAKWRKPLLEAGIQIFEMRRIANNGDEESDERLARFGSGAASLHAKTFAIDGERVFVGSFNFDPRSVALNTELGFVIESKALAQRIDGTFSDRMPYMAYELKLSPSGRIYWLERNPGEVIRHDVEPNTTLFKRTSVRILSWLPIDWLL